MEGRRYNPRQDFPKTIDDIWNELVPHGLHAKKYVHYHDPSIINATALLDDKLSVIKAMLSNYLFSELHTSDLVQQRVLELEAEFRLQDTSFSPTHRSNMLVVHLRRADKADDRAKLLPHESLPSIKETLVVIRALIRAAERLANGLQFEHIFLMSDEPEAFSPDIRNYLSSTLDSRTKILFNDFVLRL